MSKWTHSICIDCFVKKFPEKAPIKVMDVDRELCCYCSNSHTSGVYVRDDPQELRCKGIHQ